MTATLNPPTTIAREPILVIADILQEELGLADGQIMLKYEKWPIPNNFGLYISLAYIGPSRIIGSVNNVLSDGAGPSDGMTEIQTLTMLHTIQIDFLSFDASARIRKEEIAMAMASVYAEQQAELYQLQIARQPSAFLDTSSLEETKILNRFTTTINVTALHTKTKAAPYFNTFSDPEVHFNG